ncbi:N-acetylmuramoyl-L-alanine amidase [Streptomonospora sp. PA3]|uniref:N-acetylmuramoyl-L-alanine amidase n=1 Tax=Streptomonospora sp. PA3 TaxID=2607326 RepID=UPI0012DFD09F|nr:N-acetylmuramoyl-L-alanine amidase [Streptomonospora sp. PA3]MUL39641.1 N-acetylmuramoyl-L-alanine amidase [Streptomonospora sp. PA3]
MSEVAIIDRSEWGARAPRGREYVSWDARTEFIVHHSAGPTTQTVRSIQDFHLDGRGWSDIGYNLLVDDDGNAYEGRGWLVVGAHAVGHNRSGIGVCYIGENNPTPAAMVTIRALYDEACERAGRRLSAKGHGDVNETSCPGGELHDWVHDGMPTNGLGGDNDMSLINLTKGAGPDTGEREHVIALQSMIVKAGRRDALGDAGVDGRYGDATAEGLRLCRADVGSEAKEGWGDRVSGHAYSQLHQAVMRQEIREVLAEMGGSGGGSAEVPQDLTVRSLTAQRISVG